MDMLFSIQGSLHILLRHIFHAGDAKVQPYSPCPSSSQKFHRMQPTYHIVRAVHIAYHRYSTGACHVLIRIGPDEHTGQHLQPLPSTFFREIVTEGLSFHALEEEPVIEVELCCPNGIRVHEQTCIEHVLKKEEETRFIFLLQLAPDKVHHFGLVISYL